MRLENPRQAVEHPDFQSADVVRRRSGQTSADRSAQVIARATSTSGKACSQADIQVALRNLPEVIFHVTLACNSLAIERDGLQSACALIDAAERRYAKFRAVRGYRDRTVILPTGAALRDQRPMAPELLARCLEPPLSVVDWYGLVNARVFFWVDPARLKSYLKASARSDQVVYTVATESLVSRHANCMEVTPFNVGYAKRRGAARGLRTFVALREWARTGWAAERAAGKRCRAPTAEPVELAVRGSVHDFHRFVTDRRAVIAER